jgi:hypothetical protein
MTSLTATEVSTLIKEGVASYKMALDKATEEGMATAEKEFRADHEKYLQILRSYIEKEIKGVIDLAQKYGTSSSRVTTYNVEFMLDAQWQQYLKFLIDGSMNFSYKIPSGKWFTVTFNPFKKYNLQPIYEILMKEYTDRGFKVSQDSDSKYVGISGFDVKEYRTYYYLTISWE